ncbi:restriction endonuclease subunit S [Pseudomonas sp. NPDC077649]|uniref:restriction endonuclease subunit S n=1 Tax=Pseudomonas sp. NPDC077649 TaxID=3364423 RepID=UPI0037CA0F60
MSFPAYPAYKDSGVDWLGEIPEGWSIKPLWALFRRHKLTGFPDEQLLSVYRDYGVIPKASRDDNFNKPSDDLGAYQLVQVGDLVINKMKAWQGSVGIASYKGIVSPAYHVYAPGHSEAPQYLHHLFRCNEYIAGYLANSKGIRVNQWDLEPQQHSRMSVLLPSFQEQTQIARFLDHETARIDALIEEQQRLIELLKEKRQAVISHAVTKGLDPTVPMKDSGVEWLGEVPAHWGVSKLKFITDRVVDCPHETPNYNPDGNYLVIRTADLDQGILKPEQMYRLDKDEYVRRTRRSSLEMNDVVYGREGERWGHAALVPESDLYALGQRMMQFRVSDQVCPEYFMFQLNSIAVYGQGEVDTVGATSPHVNISTIINFQMMIPPQEEQARISNYLNKTLRNLDSLINESADAMGLLQERRSALISAAVTGKVDVRGWQPPTSTQAPELLVAEAV